jgi:hypothetical protein
MGEFGTGDNGKNWNKIGRLLIIHRKNYDDP